ncbi:MAG: (Fe-S)-binding protein, partial [Acidimicrobiia bacterium]|nr:(Fe-S)-binding protein [Acidimicrobiia bacterium]
MSPNRLASVSSDDLATCVGCGLCLPHCPTFRVSGEEGLSPRGRIATMKGLSTGEIDFDATAVRVLDTCVQCRACEPACPSGVPYGRMIEAATTEMADSKMVTPWWLRLGLRGLRHHRILLMTRPVLVLAQRLRLAPRRIGPGRLSWRNGPPVTSTASSPDIWVFTGCVMDVWQRHTHRAVADLAKLLGLTVATPAASGSCCGALHTHAGMHEQSLELARRTMKSMPGDAP